jgi:hypothetical protein
MKICKNDVKRMRKKFVRPVDLSENICTKMNCTTVTIYSCHILKKIKGPFQGPQ